MEIVQSWLDYFWELLRVGFHDINAQILGLLVAMLAAYFLSKWQRVFIVAIGAVVAFLVAQVMIGVIAQNQKFQLPSWLVDDPQRLLGIYAGFILVITIFYVVKKMMLKSGH
jgi:hypothetical protein